LAGYAHVLLTEVDLHLVARRRSKRTVWACSIGPDSQPENIALALQALGYKGAVSVFSDYGTRTCK
jgi:hypothetical protein